MRAIVRRAGQTTLAASPSPGVARSDDVVIEVAVAGICRTDLYVADGRIPCEEPRVLGHELSGVVAATGAVVTRVARGDRVTVMPWIGCGACLACSDERPWRCTAAEMLGVDRDGAFAERLVVPARVVHRLPTALSFTAGAYAEPVAAALAVRHARIGKSERVLILGAGRIAELTRRVLAADGVTEVVVIDPSRGSVADLGLGGFDVAIEAHARPDVLAALLDAVRPGGTIVLKSRPAEPVSLDLARAVRREIRMLAVGYAPMDDALALLASGRLGEDELFEAPAPLEAFEDVFAAARASESKKRFFAPVAAARSELA